MVKFLTESEVLQYYSIVVLQSCYKTDQTGSGLLLRKNLAQCHVIFSEGRVTLRDLKRCRMAHVFFNTFFNLEKYLDNEQRDPFAVQKV